MITTIPIYQTAHAPDAALANAYAHQREQLRRNLDALAGTVACIHDELDDGNIVLAPILRRLDELGTIGAACQRSAAAAAALAAQVSDVAAIDAAISGVYVTAADTPDE